MKTQNFALPVTQETQNYLVKAVVGLLQEARPFGSSREQEESHRRTMQVLDDEEEEELVEDEATLNERRLLSRYGVWLLVNRCQSAVASSFCLPNQHHWRARVVLTVRAGA